MKKKQQLAAILVGVLGFGAAVTEAQVAAPVSLPGNFSPYLTGVDRESGLWGAGSNNIPGFISSDSRPASAPFLTNDTLSLPRPEPNVISRVDAGAGDNSVVFVANGLVDGSPVTIGGGTDTTFTHPAYPGLRFNLSPRVSLGLGYKNLAAEDPYYDYQVPWNFATVLGEGVKNRSLLFTVRLKF